MIIDTPAVATPRRQELHIGVPCLSIQLHEDCTSIVKVLHTSGSFLADAGDLHDLATMARNAAEEMEEL